MNKLLISLFLSSVIALGGQAQKKENYLGNWGNIRTYIFDGIYI